MSPNEAISCIHQGQLVKCSESEYRSGVREALHDYAAEMIDTSQDVRAIIALEEVRRLDGLYPVIRHVEGAVE